MNTAGRRRPLFFFHSFVNIYSEGIKAKLLNFRPERGIHINGLYKQKLWHLYAFGVSSVNEVLYLHFGCVVGISLVSWRKKRQKSKRLTFSERLKNRINVLKGELTLMHKETRINSWHDEEVWNEPDVKRGREREWKKKRKKEWILNLQFTRHEEYA